MASDSDRSCWPTCGSRKVLTKRGNNATAMIVFCLRKSYSLARLNKFTLVTPTERGRLSVLQGVSDVRYLSVNKKY